MRLVYGAWGWLIVSLLVVLYARGGVAAANFALPGVLLVLLIHGSVWLYKKFNRKAFMKRQASQPIHPSIDDTIYDQVANEMGDGNIIPGLMTRAISEAGGDKDKTQAIYIKLRAATISKEQKAKEATDIIIENPNNRLQTQADLEKELKARRFKAEMIAKYQTQRNANHRDGKIFKILLGILVIPPFLTAVKSRG